MISTAWLEQDGTLGTGTAPSIVLPPAPNGATYRVRKLSENEWAVDVDPAPPWISLREVAEQLPFRPSLKRVRRVMADRGIRITEFGKTPMVWRQEFYRAFGGPNG